MVLQQPSQIAEFDDLRTVLADWLAELWRLQTDEQIDLLGASLSQDILADWVSGATHWSC